MITAILAMVVAWGLFYGRLPAALLALLCILVGVGLGVVGRHKHTQYLIIDVYAQSSHLNKVNPLLKVLTVMILIIICVSSGTAIVGVYLAIIMILLVVLVGGLKLHAYVHLLALPLSFLLLSGMALLFEVSRVASGVIQIPMFGWWLCISADAQIHTTLVMARAIGAVSCLYLLSLTTPMSEIIGVLRRLHCPGIIIELMYLIYRYIFILLSMYHTMRNAAKSRLGFINYRANIRTTGNLYSNLLSRSYRYAGRNFDAMESRCYDTEIRFLEKRKPATMLQILTAVGIIIVALGICQWLN